MMSAQQDASDLPRLPERAADSHKGDYGRALLIGGSRGMTGAITLAGTAALRGGAGLVKLAVPEVCQDTIAGFEPSYMTIGLPSDADGRIAAREDDLSGAIDEATAVGLGPGLGRSSRLDELIVHLYRHVAKPMVCDADALNALAGYPDVLRQPGGPRVLTPHPGEFARLIGGEKLPDEERRKHAAEVAAQWGVVVVLKGCRTLITDGSRTATNETGNPGMATGGTGDVLTGLTTALLCQGLAAWEAARLAAHVHGLAGDLAAEEQGQAGLIASDLVQYLPDALQEMVDS